ncbi:MAG: hypothetical protein JOZ97_09050 [Candidatus Eremiobacteraeota bacterium]|nr:hypothetical protein [Candidatus Eremiobacteraeota bacterium]
MSCTSHPATLAADVPLAGPDAAQGILALQAVRLAIDERRDNNYTLQLDVRDASGGGFADPHEEEGAGDWRNPGFAAKNVAALASKRDVIAIVGGLNEAVARAESMAAQRFQIPIVLAARASGLMLHGLQHAEFETAYRRRYAEAPDPLAERFYAAAKLILDCRSHSRAELAECLSKRERWNH